jgi:predicted transcriptional regulator of viral defense system
VLVAVVEALRGRELTVAEVFAAVEKMHTTREALRKMLARLAREGRIERLRPGVYRAADDEAGS